MLDHNPLGPGVWVRVNTTHKVFVPTLPRAALSEYAYLYKDGERLNLGPWLAGPAGIYPSWRCADDPPFDADDPALDTLHRTHPQARREPPFRMVRLCLNRTSAAGQPLPLISLMSELVVLLDAYFVGGLFHIQHTADAVMLEAEDLAPLLMRYTRD